MIFEFLTLRKTIKLEEVNEVILVNVGWLHLIVVDPGERLKRKLNMV